MGRTGDNVEHCCLEEDFQLIVLYTCTMCAWLSAYANVWNSYMIY